MIARDTRVSAARSRDPVPRFCVALLLALAVSGCARFVDVRETDLLKEAQLGRLAILPFTTDLYVEKSQDSREPFIVCLLEGKRFDVSTIPPSAPGEITALFAQQLSIKGGYDLILPGEVGAFIKRRQLDPSVLGPRAFFGLIAEGLDVDAVVAANVYLYEERRGSSFGAERPASVSIDIHLLDGRSGELLWEADYNEAQSALSDNVGNLGLVVQRGAQFLTVSELASWAVEQIIERFPEPAEKGVVILYPAVDIKAGAAVRLVQGDMARETRYDDNPETPAMRWEQEGASWLHIVDLDGAVEGETRNLPAIKRILAAVKIPVQIGGGIRTLASAERLLELGAARVVMGTAALLDPDLLSRAAARFPGQIALGLDARDGRVAIRGWKETSAETAIEVARRFDGMGLPAIIYTDIEVDGTLRGPNVQATEALALGLQTPVIASGGIGSLEDLRRVADLADAGVAGVIVGRALYTGAVNLPEGIEILAAPLTRGKGAAPGIPQE